MAIMYKPVLFIVFCVILEVIHGQSYQTNDKNKTERDCKKGYVFDQNVNKCVPIKDCTPTCGLNERFIKCGKPCPEASCDNLNPEPCLIKSCRTGCFCDEGYVRNEENKCVLPTQCITLTCGLNERFIKCGKPCPEASCDNLNPEPCLIKSCRTGCFCDEGYVRNKDNKCILPKQCNPSVCGKNERYLECGSPCPVATCDNPIPKPCFIDSCGTGCFCDEGYIRNKENKCVLLEECPKPVCGDNEQYVECGSPCPVATCENPNPKPCLISSCGIGCFCKEGYVRNKDNKCVLLKQCNIKCKKNSHFDKCPPSCPGTCAYTLSRYCSKECRPGCKCDDGYVLDKIGGECIKLEKCKGLGVCSANETWVNCNSDCQEQYCPYDDEPEAVCDAPNPCPGGCRCNINFRRNAYGQCQYASECKPVECTRQNEIWDPCTDLCSSDDCSEAFKPPVTCNSLLLNCQPQCVCKKNHFRNERGLCVPANECRYCTDPNAHFKDCPDPCPATCQYTLPRECDQTCYPGCQCNEGYVLSETNGQCVKIEECSSYANCGTNQTFLECNHRCPGRVCPRNDRRVDCRPAYPCAGGCGCLPGYRWNSNNECIWAGDCPEIKCTSRPNEYFHPCSSPELLDDCTNQQNQEDLPTPETCIPWCICKKGYFRDISYNCIPRDECPANQE